MAGHESLSEQSRRRTTRIMLVAGLIVFILFMVVLCSQKKEEKTFVPPPQEIGGGVASTIGDGEEDGLLLPDFGTEDVSLNVNPPDVTFQDIIIGMDAQGASATLLLTAKGGPISIKEKMLASDFARQEKGTEQEEFTSAFEFAGSCMEKDHLEENETCVLNIAWKPTTIQNITDTLNIRWIHDNPRVFDDQQTVISIKANSKDNVECICCEEQAEKAKKVPRKVLGLDGKEYVVDENGEVWIDGKKMKVEGELVIDPETGEIVSVIEPERVALGLNNEFLGRVTDTRTVLKEDGTTLGKLLGDDTLVDDNLNVLGAVIPLVSVLDAQGVAVGKLVADEKGAYMVDAAGERIGVPRVDKTVVDKAGVQVGVLRGWGLALDLNGDLLGGILPDGSVLNSNKTIVGQIQQNGFVNNEKGQLIGGVAPQGIVVSTGCRSFGRAGFNGEVKDSYGQVVGRALLDGAVVDANYNEIGTVVNEGLIVDMKGAVLGFINSEGKGIDSTGSMIGCVGPNGMLVAGKKTLGGVLQKGNVTGKMCGTLGSVYPDGQVKSITMSDVGKVRADGLVVDGVNKTIGRVVTRGTVLAEGCRLVGEVSLTGQIVNERNLPVGCVDMQKQAIDFDGKELGKLTPVGPVFAPDGSLVGRVRYDGQIVDKNGKILDCVNPDGTSSVGVAANGEAGGGGSGAAKGVILDASGLPTGLTALSGKCYNDKNEEVGTVAFNGWVYDKQGQLLGFIPPNGLVFSFNGSLLGSYNSLMGTLFNMTGDPLGRVMPDGTVVNEAGTQILGGFIPENATFAGLTGATLGKIDLEGRVLSEVGDSVGRVLADGSLYDMNNALIGGVVQAGPVFSADGSQVGWANANGDVVSKGTRIASLLPNGLAVTPDNRVLGYRMMPLSVVVTAGGVSGVVVPKAKTDDTTAYQLGAYDKNGEYLGKMSAFGVLLGSDGRLSGEAVPVSMVIDLNHRFIGWLDFKGQVVDTNGKNLGVLSTNYLVVNANGDIVGSVVRKGTVVNERGDFVGRVGPDGVVYNGMGDAGFKVGKDVYTFNLDYTQAARVLPVGMALSSEGTLLGWTGFDGALINTERLLGKIYLNNRAMDAQGNVLGGYVPLGAPSLHEDEKMCGVVNERGAIVSAGGQTIGSVLAPDYAVKNNAIVGRLRSGVLTAHNLTDNGLLGAANFDSLVYKPNTTRQVGSLMMNDFVVDATKKVVGGLAKTGFAISSNLKSLGVEDYKGSVWLGGQIVGAPASLNVITQNDGYVSGALFEPEVIVDRAGTLLGYTNAQGAVLDKNGQKIASRMAFYSALATDNVWVGGPITTGAVVDDYAEKVGVVAADGLVMSGQKFKGRVLPDASVAGVSEPAVYNTMPYAGHVVAQGLPMGYTEKVLGRTTSLGDVVDGADKVIYKLLDDGTILGKERPLEGSVLTFRPAVSLHNSLLGMMDGDGKVFSPAGEIVGRAVSNGAILAALSEDASAKDKLKEAGGLIPEGLVVNDACKVIGQTSYNGEVIDGKGNSVGRMQPTLVAKDLQGTDLGHAVRYGPITTFDTKGVFLGRTLPNSMVVDPDGVVIGCARTDKILVDLTGNELGQLRDRGPVFDLEKKMVGRVDAMGRVVGLSGEVMGVIGGRGEDVFYDFEGNKRGWMATKEDRLTFNPDGTLDQVVSRDGWVKDGNGTVLFKIDQASGNVYDKWGNLIGNLDEMTSDENLVYLYDMEDKIVARLAGCDLHKVPNGEKMGSLLANGEIHDENDELILTADADNKVYNPDRTQYGSFKGVGLDLRRCGLSSVSLKEDGVPISWGGKKDEYRLLPGDIIVDNDGAVVGKWDPETFRPFFWDKPQVAADPNEGREPPAPPKKPTYSRELIDGHVDLQKKRRQMMREKMGGTPTIIPGPEIQARLKGKKDKDWGGEKTVSTWPVDMSRVLLADKAIPAVLVRSIDSRFSDVPVTAIVERHIYAEEGRNILIPAGSRLIGNFGGLGGAFSNDQSSKLSISWTRLIRPDGAAFSFNATSGDAQGRGGVSAYLDLQLMKKFLVPFMSTIGEGLILKLTEINEKQILSGPSAASGTADSAGGSGNNSTQSESAAHQTRQMFINNFKQMYDQLLQMTGNVPEIVFVPAGTRLVAYPQTDLWLRSTEDEEEELKEKGLSNPLEALKPKKNDSWTAKRSGKDEEEEEEEPEEGEEIYEEPVYMPEDIEERTIDPVNESVPNQSGGYF